MSYTEELCRLVKCDGCGKLLGDDGDYVVHFPHESSHITDADVQDYLDEYGWTWRDGLHHCIECPVLVYDGEDEDEGEVAHGERGVAADTGGRRPDAEDPAQSRLAVEP